MNILYKRNTHNGSEVVMQDDVVKLLLSNRLYEGARNVQLYTEVPCPQVGRRSDIVLVVGKQKSYYNIECKIVNVAKVLEQAKDHLRWADYSYICLKTDTYIAPYQIQEMIKFNIGLLLWEPEILVECLQTRKSKYIIKPLRAGVIETINMLNPKNPQDE